MHLPAEKGDVTGWTRDNARMNVFEAVVASRSSNAAQIVVSSSGRWDAHFWASAQTTDDGLLMKKHFTHLNVPVGYHVTSEKGVIFDGESKIETEMQLILIARVSVM